MIVSSRFDAVDMVKEALSNHYLIYRVDKEYSESCYPDKYGSLCRESQSMTYYVYVICVENHVPYRVTVDCNDGIGDIVNWQTGELTDLEKL